MEHTFEPGPFGWVVSGGVVDAVSSSRTTGLPPFTLERNLVPLEV